MNESHNQQMARLMRETADLIERGLIPWWQVDIEYGHRTEPDPRYGGFTMHTVATGERTVTIELRGYDWQNADWTPAQSSQAAIGDEQKRLR